MSDWKPVLIVTEVFDSEADAEKALMRQVRDALLAADGRVMLVRRAPKVDSQVNFESDTRVYRGSARFVISPESPVSYESHVIGTFDG